MREVPVNPEALVTLERSTMAQMWPNASEAPRRVQGPEIVMTDSLKTQLKDLSVAQKFDQGKPDWSLVPFEALEGMVKVLEFGAKKYDSWNWTTDGGFKWTRVLSSCFRHLFAWARGQDLDPESGLSHIHHAQCNLLFLAFYLGNKEKFNKDDRNVR